MRSASLQRAAALAHLARPARLHTLTAAYNAFAPTHEALPALRERAAQRGLCLILAR